MYIINLHIKHNVINQIQLVLCVCVHVCLRWYYGNINRQKAEKLLLAPQNKTGSFLVRISESHSDEYTISGETAVIFIIYPDHCLACSHLLY